jgi:hypothetical protein
MAFQQTRQSPGFGALSFDLSSTPTQSRLQEPSAYWTQLDVIASMYEKSHGIVDMRIFCLEERLQKV